MLFRKRRDFAGMTAEEHIRRARANGGRVAVTSDSALRHSAVWACVRLRANLISTMPVDVFRRVEGMQVEAAKTPILVNPGGERVGIQEWLYSTQSDLDRGGNCFGIISERDGQNLPRRIDLVPLAESSVQVKGGKLTYRLGGKVYQPEQVWHEKQYTVSGLPVGLSPIAYAAWTIGEYLNIQEFASSWFGNGGRPSAHLKNSNKTLTDEQASKVKQRFRDTVSAGDVFVTGQDWTYEMIQADQAGSNWLEAKQYGLADVARFMDCPADMIDAAVSGSSITYANITQRNLQFLITSLGPAVVRREAALSMLLPRPRYVKLNSDALLRMDPQTRAEVLKTQIEARTLAPSEARELDNRRPFTPEQMAEFDRFWPAKQTPQSAAS